MTWADWFPLVWLVVCVGCYLSLQASDTWAHEQAHVQINRLFGCSNISVQLDYWGIAGGRTYCGNISLTGEQMNSFDALHSLNEIVGYNVNSLINTAIMCTFLLGTLNLFLKINQD